MICHEFGPDEAARAVDGGDVPELAAARTVTHVDIDAGRWPMVSTLDALAGVFDSIAWESR